MRLFRTPTPRPKYREYTRCIRSHHIQPLTLECDLALWRPDDNKTTLNELYLNYDGTLVAESEGETWICARNVNQMRELAAFVNECADALEGK